MVECLLYKFHSPQISGLTVMVLVVVLFNPCHTTVVFIKICGVFFKYFSTDIKGFLLVFVFVLLFFSLFNVVY